MRAQSGLARKVTCASFMPSLYAAAKMAVYVNSDRDSTRAATVRGVVDMRQGGRHAAGSFSYQGERLVSGWHAHDLHQVEYALGGLVEVETASGHYVLPPQQAVWIPAGLLHESTMHTAVHTVSVFFEPPLITDPGDRVRILAVAPLIREMIMYAARWPIDRDSSDVVADNYFVTLAQLVGDALDHEAPLRLPTTVDPLVAAAMSYTRDHLQSVTIDDVAQAVVASARTLRRRFASEVGLPWRTYHLQARLLGAMASLAKSDATILDVSTEVGFNSLSAFSRAFVTHCGETPSTYRRRVRPLPRSPHGGLRSVRGSRPIAS
jgi:AraC-like DNA-binding protein